MRKLEYKQSNGDHILFLKIFSLGGVIILVDYIDNIIITRSNLVEDDNMQS